MTHHASSTFTSISVILVILACCGNSMPPRVLDIEEKLVEGKGLYDENDFVTVINATNFKNTIYGTKNAWVVQFYNSWCGHCFAFAPKYKSLAVDVYAWRKVLKLAVIDCSNEENNPTCRDYDIMGYPTIKYFPDQAPYSKMGTEISPGSLEDGSTIIMERMFIGILQKEQLDGRGQNWPNLISLRNSDLSTLQTKTTQNVFLIIEDEGSILGTQVILDFSMIDEVQIRTVSSDNEALVRTLGVNRFPSVVYIPHNRIEPEILHPAENTREGIRKAIRAFLTAKGFTLPEEMPDKVIPTVNPRVNLAQLMKQHNTKKQLKEIKKQGDVVFLADLEMTLKYMLLHEIPSKKVITGEEFDALDNFLLVISKYFPAGEAGIEYLKKIHQGIASDKKTIGGIKFKNLVKETNGGINSVLTTQEGWLGCKGSSPNKRQYPCGAWTTFHYLVAAADHSSDPLLVLNAMLAYIKNFFGCTECSKHFQEMVVSRGMRAKVTNPDQAILWLWGAHNEVNKRLAGNPTEDEEFPKIQYPSDDACPKCRDSAGNWNEIAVLTYLKNKYHRDSLNYQGANSRPQPVPNKSQTANRHLVEVEDDLQTQSGKYFNSLDMSILVILYVASAVICAAVCWKFILRRHYRKKGY